MSGNGSKCTRFAVRRAEPLSSCLLCELSTLLTPTSQIAIPRKRIIFRAHLWALGTKRCSVKWDAVNVPETGAAIATLSSSPPCLAVSQGAIELSAIRGSQRPCRRTNPISSRTKPSQRIAKKHPLGRAALKRKNHHPTRAMLLVANPMATHHVASVNPLVSARSLSLTTTELL